MVTATGSRGPQGREVEESVARVLGDVQLSEEWSRVRGTMEAEQFEAMLMELAFLDARLMEPSNRGLSDRDIVNSLTRLVGKSANPMSFLHRQMQWAINMEDRIDNFGRDIPLGQWTFPQIQAALISKDYLDNSRGFMLELQESIKAEMARQNEMGNRSAEGLAGGGEAGTDDTQEISDADRSTLNWFLN